MGDIQKQHPQELPSGRASSRKADGSTAFLVPAKVPAVLLEQCVGQASKLACPKTSKRARQYEETCQDTEWMRKWLAREPISFATQVAIQHCMMKHFPCHYSAALQLWVPRLRAFLSTLKLFTNLQSVFWLEAREAKLKKDTVICKSILVKVRVLSFCL